LRYGYFPYGCFIFEISLILQRFLLTSRVILQVWLLTTRNNIIILKVSLLGVSKQKFRRRDCIAFKNASISLRNAPNFDYLPKVEQLPRKGAKCFKIRLKSFFEFHPDFSNCPDSTDSAISN
jgi:hypothetical protein